MPNTQDYASKSPTPPSVNAALGTPTPKAEFNTYRPEVGCAILVDTGSREFNGSRIHPAIVTRQGGTYLNCRVFVDGNETLWITSIQHVSKVSKPTTFMQQRPTYWMATWERDRALD